MMERINDFSTKGEANKIFCSVYDDDGCYQSGIMILDKKDYLDKNIFLEKIEKFKETFDNPLGKQVVFYKWNEQVEKDIRKNLSKMENREYMGPEEFNEDWFDFVISEFDKTEKIENVHTDIDWYEVLEI